MITAPMDFVIALNIVIGVAIVIGGFFGFRNGKQTQLAKFQRDTNDALQQRIEVLEGKIADFEKENIIQRHVLETITMALKKEGFIITVSGDMVTIENSITGIKGRHRRRITTTQSSSIKKEEDV